MSQIIKFSDKLNEMLIHPSFQMDEGGGKYNILAYDKYIYFVMDEDTVALAKLSEIINKNKTTSFKINTDADYNGMLEEIIEYYPNILVFEYDSDENDTIILNAKNEFRQDYRTSKYVIDTFKKLNREFNIDFMKVVDNVDNDQMDTIEDTYYLKALIDDWEEDIKYTKLPKYIYHGTSIKYLEDILKRGIQPSAEKSNYDGIRHKSRIFFASDKVNTMFHANKAAFQTKQPPIILQIDSSGLDINKIDFDYDFYTTYVAKKDANHDYSKIGSPVDTYNPKTLAKLKDKYVGATYRKFAYKGILFPKYIVAIHYNTNQDNSTFNVRVSREDFNDFIEKYEYMSQMLMDFSNEEYDLDDYLYHEMKSEEEENRYQEERERELEEVQEKKIIKFNEYTK